MAERLQCLVCGARRARNACHVIKLTVEERHMLREQGKEVLDEYPYCKPCWKIISDPISGPNLMKGLAQTHLRRLGVSNAEELAEKYRAGLLKLSEKGPKN